MVLPAPLVPMRPTTSPGSHLDRHACRPRTRPPKRTDTSRGDERQPARGSPAARRVLTRVDRSATPSVRARCGGFQLVRRAMNASSWSRPVSTIEISPPGQYSNRISMPTPLANSWSSWLPSKTVGMPTIDDRAEHRAGDRREPADDRDREHLERLSGREVVGDAGRVPRREQAAGERGDAARDREGDQLRPRRATRCRRPRWSRCRAPRAASGRARSAEVRDEQDHEDRDDEAEVVVALLVCRRKSHGPTVGGCRRCPLAGERVVEEVVAEHPGAHDQREAERDDPR